MKEIDKLMKNILPQYHIPDISVVGYYDVFDAEKGMCLCDRESRITHITIMNQETKKQTKTNPNKITKQVSTKYTWDLTDSFSDTSL